VKGIFDSPSVPGGGHYLIYHTEGVPHAARPTSIPCSQSLGKAGDQNSALTALAFDQI
jgi:hypothetical protein